MRRPQARAVSTRRFARMNKRHLVSHLNMVPDSPLFLL